MEATGGTNKVSTTLTLLGLFFDIAGAMLLVWGEIKGTMAFLRYSTTGDGSTLFDRDRKSTRLNSSHLVISYAVFCLKKKNKYTNPSIPILRRRSWFLNAA